jgi:adenylate cyclase
VHLLVTGVLYVSTDGERRFVRRAFGQYLAPELLAKLERQPRGLVLGGEMREMSIMFMDVRGFTPISETLSATDLVHFLNTLLSPLSEAIQAQDGTIDKYIGDSIMAFWNAPVDVEDHAARACRAALRMGEIVREMNERDAFGFRAMGRRDLTVRIGVGINTGEACVGNMGSERRFNYSVIGDAVNTAARIEASCKAVGADLLVSEETMRAAPGFAVLEAGRVALKGKARPAALYALVGDESLGASAAFREFARLHERLIAAIDGGDAQAASVLVALCRRAAPVDLDAFYDRFDETVRGIGSAPAEPARAAG